MNYQPNKYMSGDTRPRIIGVTARHYNACWLHVDDLGLTDAEPGESIIEDGNTRRWLCSFGGYSHTLIEGMEPHTALLHQLTTIAKLSAEDVHLEP